MANALSNIIISAVDKTQAAFRAVNNNLKTMEDRATSINSVFSRFLPLLGAASVTAFAKNIIDSADGLKDLSERTGVSISRLAAFDLAAQQNGSSLEALAKAMAFGSRAIVQNSDDLKKLGIDAKNSEELIFQLADVIASLPEDDPRRVAIAMQFLGKSAGELIPLLSQGGDELRRMAEEGAKAAKAMEELAPEADAFNDNLARLQQSSTLVGAKTFLPLIRYLNQYAESGAQANGFTETLLNNLTLIGDTNTGFYRLLGLFDDSAEQAEKAAAATKKFNKETEVLENQLDLLNRQLDEQQQNLAKNQKSVVLDAYKQNINVLEKQVDGFKDLGKAMVDSFTAAGAAAADASTKANDLLKNAAQIRQSAEDRVSDINLRDATPEAADAVRNQQILDALEKSRSARIQADYQRLLGNTEQAEKQLSIAEQQALRADDITGKLNDEGFARQQILDAADALARVEESRAAVQQTIAKQETERQAQLQQKMVENQAEIEDLTLRLQELNAKVQEISGAEASVKFTADQEAINKTLADIANVKAQLAQLAQGVTVPIRTVATAAPVVTDGRATITEFAQGGPISGPGTSTSDSIFARLSNGEYVIKAAAVEKYGLGFMHALNNMNLPKFAKGGALTRLRIPDGPLRSGPVGSGMDRGTFVLPGGERLEVHAKGDVFDRLTALSLQHRKRR